MVQWWDFSFFGKVAEIEVFHWISVTESKEATGPDRDVRGRSPLIAIAITRGSDGRLTPRGTSSRYVLNANK